MTAAPAKPDGPQNRGPLREVALLFLRLGTTVFGGPAAHIARMHEEVVTRRRWITSTEFFELLATTNFIPGPNSTEMAIHIGARRAGWRGLLVAGAAFILPAAVMTLALAWAYVRFGASPEVERFLDGVKPVIIAIVVQAIWTLGKTALNGGLLQAVAVAALAAAAAGAHELLILLGAGMVVAAVRSAGIPHRAALAWTGLLPAGLALAPAAARPVAVSKIFLAFLKIGSVLFGSGYVLLAFLRSDLVVRHGWLTERQLLDAVTAGQVTPGPVFSTATFVGYLLGGAAGGVAATVGIFLPSFVFVAATNPLLRFIRRWPSVRDFLDGIVAASLALMLLVTWELAHAAIHGWRTAALTAASVALLFFARAGSGWLILAGGLIGLAGLLGGL